MPAVLTAYRYGDRRIFARLICAVTGGDTAHCEVAIPQDDGAFMCISSSWLDGGVRAKKMALPADKWRLYQTDISSHQAYSWLREHEMQPYGWWKLVRFVMPWLRPSWGGPICTEAVAEITGTPMSDNWTPRQLEAVDAMRWERIQ